MKAAVEPRLAHTSTEQEREVPVSAAYLAHRDAVIKREDSERMTGLLNWFVLGLIRSIVLGIVSLILSN